MKKNKTIEEKVLYEITNFCNECLSKEKCPEEDCVLYRIEKLILELKNDKGV